MYQNFRAFISITYQDIIKGPVGDTITTTTDIIATQVCSASYSDLIQLPKL
jgi:hypothetical protein